jgi:hypothetical protein
MKRDDVYNLIDGERLYQDSMPEHQNRKQQINTSVAAWIIYMETQLARARIEIYNMNEQEALEFIRKCTAVGVACMEYNETLPRK